MPLAIAWEARQTARDRRWQQRFVSASALQQSSLVVHQLAHKVQVWRNLGPATFDEIIGILGV